MIVEMFLLLLLPPPLAAVHIAGWIRTCADRSMDSIHVYSSAVLSFPIPMFQWSLDSLTCFLLSDHHIHTDHIACVYCFAAFYTIEISIGYYRATEEIARTTPQVVLEQWRKFRLTLCPD
jgi:hypothetical protein